MKTDFKTIDEYISNFPADIKTILQNIRNIIRRELPEATEIISYQMPTFRLNLSSREKFRSNLSMNIYFAAFKKHIGLFFAPTEEVYKHFKKELSGYKKSKGGIQIPMDKPIDYELIRKIVRYKKELNLT